jgi:predicted RND superfamily exporter protein
MKSNGRWLQLWFPQDLAQQSTIEENYPKAISFLDLVNEFPKVITDELKWMIPTCFLLIFSLLWIYYRRFLPAMAALLPFAVGLGTLAWARFFGLPFSFVSLVGVTLLLGLGVDYGIFAVDHGLFISTNPNEVREDGLTSALLFAGGTTIAGYLPLLFCGHQVLVHLGQVLALGTLGSLLGAFWATPQFMRWCVR